MTRVWRVVEIIGTVAFVVLVAERLVEMAVTAYGWIWP
jgi:hypothetical protein